MVSCGLVVSFDEYGLPPHRSAGVFSVRGEVTGLDGDQATLLLGRISLEVADGPFAFPPTLADGEDFEVTVRSPQAHVCAVARGKGKIAGADATDVSVTCISRDPRLKALSVSVGPLSPAFDSGTLTYTVRARLQSPVAALLTTISVTATPTSPSARMSIGGLTLEPGTPSPAITIKGGTNALDIAVVATDGSMLHYTVIVDGTDFDYVKPSDPAEDARFGTAVALSGATLAVTSRGTVYVFTRSGLTWSQQALWKPPQPAIALALDGDTLVTGASNAPGVVVYTRVGTTWSPQPLDVGVPALHSVALSGTTLAVGYYDFATLSVSVRIFERIGSTWIQHGAFAHEADEPPPGPPWAPALALSGNTLVVGHSLERSAATGIDGDQNDKSFSGAGAAYVVGRSGTTWSMLAYLKASNTRAFASFGASVAVSADTVVVCAPGEGSNATGVGGDQTNESVLNAGAAYVFRPINGKWSQEAYLKGASLQGLRFGRAVAMLTDTVAVGAASPDGSGPGTATATPGAVYLFRRSVGVWMAGPRVVPPGVYKYDAEYGSSLAVASDLLVVGAPRDASRSKGINGDSTDESLFGAGAVYLH